jgi:hypothetical protein
MQKQRLACPAFGQLVSDFTGVKHQNFDTLGYRNTDTMKAFKTTELKMPDIVRLSSILTQKLTHFHI